MDENEKIKARPLEIVEPIGKRVLIRKDEDKKETKGGIKLPDNIEIPRASASLVAPVPVGNRQVRARRGSRTITG